MLRTHDDIIDYLILYTIILRFEPQRARHKTEGVAAFGRSPFFHYMKYLKPS